MTFPDKDSLAVGKDLTIESFRTDEEEPHYHIRFDIKPIESEPIIRGIPKTIPRHDSFLDYLEFKMNQPWYTRLFFP